MFGRDAMASLLSNPSKLIRRNSEPSNGSDGRRGTGGDDTTESLGQELDDQPISPVTKPTTLLTSESVLCCTEYARCSSGSEHALFGSPRRASFILSPTSPILPVRPSTNSPTNSTAPPLRCRLGRPEWERGAQKAAEELPAAYFERRGGLIEQGPEK